MIIRIRIEGDLPTDTPQWEIEELCRRLSDRVDSALALLGGELADINWTTGDWQNCTTCDLPTLGTDGEEICTC